jgi:hypothetical protein
MCECAAKVIVCLMLALKRLGAVGDIQFAIKRMGENAVQHSLLVLAGDTLFYADFQLQDVLKRYSDGLNLVQSTARGDDTPFGLVLTYELADHDEVSKRGDRLRLIVR